MLRVGSGQRSGQDTPPWNPLAGPAEPDCSTAALQQQVSIVQIPSCQHCQLPPTHATKQFQDKIKICPCAWAPPGHHLAPGHTCHLPVSRSTRNLLSRRLATSSSSSSPGASHLHTHPPHAPPASVVITKVSTNTSCHLAHYILPLLTSPEVRRYEEPSCISRFCI